MSNKDQELAKKIWPQHMRMKNAVLLARRKAALAYLGEKYLLARPINRTKYR